MKSDKAPFCKKHERFHHWDEPCPYCEVERLQSIITGVTEVRNSLATQVLNSHAVRQLDLALNFTGDDDNGSTAA